MKVFLAGRGRSLLRAVVQEIGEDLVVTIYGGTSPHVGSVALAEPHLSLKKDGSYSATVSIVTCLGHKDDEIVRPCALRIASFLKKRVVVSAGFHVDKASKTMIEKVLLNSKRLTEHIIYNYSREQ